MSAPKIALRNDTAGDLDDVVVEPVRMFRAEMMDDRSLWLACYFEDESNGSLTFWVRATKKGRLKFSVTETPGEYVDWDKP